jgi:hypothetical protein
VQFATHDVSRTHKIPGGAFFLPTVHAPAHGDCGKAPAKRHYRLGLRPTLSTCQWTFVPIAPYTGEGVL